MANINFSLSALVGKHIIFTVPLDLELLSLSKNQFSSCTHQLQGVIGGFSLFPDFCEILVGDDYYKLDDIQIISISDNP